MAKDVLAFIEGAPKESRAKLRSLRAAIREAAPSAVEGLSYGMAFYSFKGESGFKARLCYFGLLKGRIVFYTRPLYLQGLAKEVKPYLTTKSSLHFSLDQPMPTALVKKVVRGAVRIHQAGLSRPR